MTASDAPESGAQDIPRLLEELTSVAIKHQILHTDYAHSFTRGGLPSSDEQSVPSDIPHHLLKEIQQDLASHDALGGKLSIAPAWQHSPHLYFTGSEKATGQITYEYPPDSPRMAEGDSQLSRIVRDTSNGYAWELNDRHQQFMEAVIDSLVPDACKQRDDYKQLLADLVAPPEPDHAYVVWTQDKSLPKCMAIYDAYERVAEALQIDEQTHDVTRTALLLNDVFQYPEVGPGVGERLGYLVTNGLPDPDGKPYDPADLLSYIHQAQSAMQRVTEHPEMYQDEIAYLHGRETALDTRVEADWQIESVKSAIERREARARDLD